MKCIEGFVAGASWSMQMSMTNPDGTPLDLTGATVFFFVKRRVEDDDELIWKKFTTHEDATGGVTNIVLTKEETAALESGQEHVAQIRVKFSSGSDEVTELLSLTPTALLSSRES
jgi:hypothetical protein